MPFLAWPKLKKNEIKFEDAMPEGESLSEVASKEFPRKLLEGKAKLEQGSFEEAKVTLCEALSISNEKTSTRSQKKGKNQKPGTLSNFLHASSLLIEAMYTKAKSFLKLGALKGDIHRVPVDFTLVLLGLCLS